MRERVVSAANSSPAAAPPPESRESRIDPRLLPALDVLAELLAAAYLRREAERAEARREESKL